MSPPTVKSKSKPKPKVRAKTASSIALAAICGLAQVESLKAQLKQTLSRATPVTLDASAVTRIDTAALQLLAAFVRARQAKGRTVVWQGVPACIEAAAQCLGLTAALAVARA
jgi:ABC-type transporter Mla MlaB component